jgi:hypothetical protein
MHTNTTRGDWTGIRDKVKARFGRLTDEAIDSSNEDLELLAERLQYAYGYARKRAESELGDFKKRLRLALVREQEPPVVKLAKARRHRGSRNLA